MATITHQKIVTIPDWVQADLDAQIALGNYPIGTLLADIELPSDWNDDHTVSDIVNADIASGAGILLSKTNISLTTTGSSGAATLDTTTGVLNIPQYSGGGGGAPTGAEYVVLSTNGSLTHERVLTAGTGISITDAGAGSTVTVASTITQYTDEMAQDAVGGILTDSAEIDFTYNDGTPSITASIVAGSIDETKLDASVNASLDLADTAVQPADIASRAIVFGAVTPSNDTIYLTTYAPFAFTINSVQNIQTSSGTITAAVKINGTNVTGLSAIAVTSSSQDVTATAANTVAIGDEVTVVLFSNSSAANLRGTILITV